MSRFLPKKYLWWTYKELTTLIQQKDEGLANLKFSTLYRYTNSKKEYVIQGKIPEVACPCADCENRELLCMGITQCCVEMQLPSKCHELINKISCKPIREDFANGTCENCPVIDNEPLKDCGNIIFNKWKKGEKYLEKTTCEKLQIFLLNSMPIFEFITTESVHKLQSTLGFIIIGFERGFVLKCKDNNMQNKIFMFENCLNV